MVFPRREWQDEGLATSRGTVEYEKHVSGTSNESMTCLLIFTSLAFLVPARTSFYIGRLWHAFVFFVMAIICAVYSVSHASRPMSLEDAVSGRWDARELVTLAHYGWAYFCFLQMGFLILGPEDAHMQWIDHPVVVDTPRSSLAMAAPLHTIVVARIVPLAAIFLFLCCFVSWTDFHWQITILIDVLLLFGCTAFWMHRDRRSSMPKVLLRVRFWRRLWNHCALPGLLVSFFWVVMENADSWAIDAVWHVLLALLAVSIIRIVHDDNGDVRCEVEIMNVCPQNPVVARILLGSVALFGIPTILLSLLMDWWSVGFWRWPMVSKATHQQPGGYFVVIGALPTLVAQAATFWLIGSTASSPKADAEEIVLSKQFGCRIGYVAVASGLLAVAVPDHALPTLHTFFVIVFLCLLLVAILLTTLSARDLMAPDTRSRCALTLAIFISVLSFLMLLILVEQYVPNSYSIPHSLLASTEYVTLALPTFWPLTWRPEVQSRWQAHKVWRSFGSNQMA